MIYWALGISIFALLWSIGTLIFIRGLGIGLRRTMKQVAGDSSTQVQVGRDDA